MDRWSPSVRGAGRTIVVLMPESGSCAPCARSKLRAARALSSTVFSSVTRCSAGVNMLRLARNNRRRSMFLMRMQVAYLSSSNVVSTALPFRKMSCLVTSLYQNLGGLIDGARSPSVDPDKFAAHRDARCAYKTERVPIDDSQVRKTGKYKQVYTARPTRRWRRTSPS